MGDAADDLRDIAEEMEIELMLHRMIPQRCSELCPWCYQEAASDHA